MLDENEQEVADEIEIRDLLDILADLNAQRAGLAAPFAEQIAALQAQLVQATADMDEQIAAVQNAVKRAIMAHGADSGNRTFARDVRQTARDLGHTAPRRLRRGAPRNSRLPQRR
jgi:hypothetical protein